MEEYKQDVGEFKCNVKVYGEKVEAYDEKVEACDKKVEAYVEKAQKCDEKVVELENGLLDRAVTSVMEEEGRQAMQKQDEDRRKAAQDNTELRHMIDEAGRRSEDNKTQVCEVSHEIAQITKRQDALEQ